MNDFKILTHEGGWNGGNWCLDDQPFDFVDHPKAIVKIKGKIYNVCYIDTHGSDYDHGRYYNWTRSDPCVMDGTIFPQPLSMLILIKNRFKIRIKLLD